MKKQILLLTILATLPLTAMADPRVGPAEYSGDDDPVMADDNPPYATIEINNDDKQHIASTAYVKGAYNDTIAGLNTVNSALADKTRLWSGNDNTILNAEVGYGAINDHAPHPEREALLIASYGTVTNTLHQTTVTVYTTWDTSNVQEINLNLPYSDR